ncbi:response regulator transcription factor [Flavihumibacter petaseus]|uniref:Putative two-component response regulator n=1 Tax=Flavihumibacter petaseus NBRC 106054 TaxID=1220578 RepID=A0A0E9MTF2_9BACT|nr:response regulator transcription factor [Flavihumibacter petaseus]GAO41037.1 putative two-component response regulator [Flavihumibacter petaseus NBRC 106054]
MKKTKILYVEDEVFLGKIVKESLETRGFDVIMETDGHLALQRFSETEPDCCVLDIMLPGTDGFAIADSIRAVNKTVPILFLSARTQTEDVVKGFAVGGHDYIRKPFSLEELIVRIHHILRIGSAAETPVTDGWLEMGLFRFHDTRQVLQSGSEERKLTYREAALLKLLCEHRNRIIDRRDILNLLWGNDSFFNSRNLDVYITRLRSYLRPDPRLQITTIKGIGYRFTVG